MWERVHSICELHDLSFLFFPDEWCFPFFLNVIKLNIRLLYIFQASFSLIASKNWIEREKILFLDFLVQIPYKNKNTLISWGYK